MTTNQKFIGLIVAAVVVGGVAWFFVPKEKQAQTTDTDLYEYSTTPTTPDPTNQGTTTPPSDSSTNSSNLRNNMHLVTINTTLGDIQFETYDADAPKTVRNFIDLADKGFYNGIIFHRVISGFMIQTGDPKGDGTGGPGYVFDDELNPSTQSYKDGYRQGVVAMANRGPNTNGSQFFIMHEEYPLPPQYTIFGRVVKGQDVVDKIASVKTDANDKPLETVTMTKVTVTDAQ